MLLEVVFVLGAPGAGKGTQCSLISEEYNFTHISVGELLRQECKRPGSEFTGIIEEKIRAGQGQLIPVEVICSLINAAMQKSGKTRFLIDGFPRTKKILDGWNRAMSDKTKLLFVLLFECSLDLCTNRCLRRGAAGSGRLDDNPESLKERFYTYANDTMLVIQYFEQLGLLRRVNGEVAPDIVFEDVKKVFNKIVIES